MSQYHKIQTIFKRDPATNHKTLLMGDFSIPEFEYLQHNEWVFTEKVDGTNIRIILSEGGMRFGGKTDNAQIPANLVARLQELFVESEMRELFPEGVVLYGEGYGPKIQKGGGNYREDQSFVLFDVRVGPWWLQRDDVDGVADRLSIDSVPIIGAGDLNTMIELCKGTLDSTWGDFRAEGIVARPATELVSRSGKRIITKLKCKDFKEEK